MKLKDLCAGAVYITVVILAVVALYVIAVTPTTEAVYLAP